MELDLLGRFYKVSQSGSISAAASILNISQPALSRSIRMLEDSLGGKLLERGRRGITLTPFGKEAIHRFEVIQSEYLSLNKKHAPKKSLNRFYRIGASENLCIHIFPQMISSLMKKESVQLDLLSGTSEQLQAALLNSEVDVAYFFNRPKFEGLASHEVAQVSFVLIAPGKGKLTESMLPSLSQALPWIGSRKRDYSRTYLALQFLQKLGIKPREMIETNSQESQIRMVEQGLGFSIVPEFAIRKVKARALRSTELRSSLFRVERVSFPANTLELDRYLRLNLI